MKNIFLFIALVAVASQQVCRQCVRKKTRDAVSSKRNINLRNKWSIHHKFIDFCFWIKVLTPITEIILISIINLQSHCVINRKKWWWCFWAILVPYFSFLAIKHDFKTTLYGRCYDVKLLKRTSFYKRLLTIFHFVSWREFYSGVEPEIRQTHV